MVRAMGAVIVETRVVAAGMVAVAVAPAMETTTIPMLRIGLHLRLGDRCVVLAGTRHGLA
jgi:hypothetical protein